MSSHGRSGGALIRPQHRNLISNKNHNCNAKADVGADQHKARLGLSAFGGAFLDKIALKEDRGTVADFKYVDGASVLPSDAEVKKLRPASAD